MRTRPGRFHGPLDQARRDDPRHPDADPQPAAGPPVQEYSQPRCGWPCHHRAQAGRSSPVRCPHSASAPAGSACGGARMTTCRAPSASNWWRRRRSHARPASTAAAATASTEPAAGPRTTRERSSSRASRAAVPPGSVTYRPSGPPAAISSRCPVTGACPHQPHRAAAALALVVFGIGAGLRPGELVALRGSPPRTADRHKQPPPPRHPQPGRSATPQASPQHRNRPTSTPGKARPRSAPVPEPGAIRKTRSPPEFCQYDIASSVGNPVVSEGRVHQIANMSWLLNSQLALTVPDDRYRLGCRPGDSEDEVASGKSGGRRKTPRTRSQPRRPAAAQKGHSARTRDRLVAAAASACISVLSGLQARLTRWSVFHIVIYRLHSNDAKQLPT